MRTIMTCALAAVLSAVAIAALAQTAPSDKGRQLASATASDPAIRAGVMASIHVQTAHALGMAQAAPTGQTTHPSTGAAGMARLQSLPTVPASK